MKILFAGAGALGSRFAFMLHQAGFDVTLIDNWETHIENIKKDGLKVIIDDKDLGNYKMPIYCSKEVKNIKEDFDVIFVSTKSMQLRPMLEDIKPLLKKDTKVICVLNGLGHVDTLKEYIDPNNILIGVTVWTSGLGGPGILKAHGVGKAEIKQVEEKDLTKTNSIIEQFNKAGLNLIYSNNVYTSIWHKAALNCVLNSYCTLIDCNINQYGSYKDHQVLTDGILDELVKVAEAEGVSVSKEIISQNIINCFDPKTAGLHYPSLYQDMKNGRLTEIDYLNGAIAKLGKKHNIATPVNAIIAHMIHSKENKNNNK
ncbi:ketopantoate reductase family protein [Mycoplasma phocoenae]|uniref:2-dehydropantoate 2-reductase n=1 Tax=Mycoplasma phocoenae TaxID=754517 RepID=A0A858U740_9MOLU|nr:2-dehydropantoate 2-reductase [Mycoplasma phocoenae]QJG67053.1 2-dehydropantoate 2-reductase [Mycoplasma phocoenae]